MDKIILASSSPRRQALLKQINIPFEVIKSDIDENVTDEVSPYDLVKIISTRKVISAIEHLQKNAILSDEPDDDEDITVIISADTIVSCKGKVFGKPKNDEEAFKMLKLLQGNHHSVYTGMAVAFKKNDSMEIKNIVDNAIVFMKDLTDDEIISYIKTKEPFDKAGAYAIQEKGAVLIEKIEGDYYTIVGLPIVKLYNLLREHNIKLNENWF